MAEPGGGRRAAGLVAVAAALNLAVSLFLALFLAPGTLAGGEGRAAFIASHPALWKAGWTSWMAGTAGLATFFVVLASVLRFSPPARLALALLVPGIAADLTHDALQSTVVVEAAAAAGTAGGEERFLHWEAVCVVVGGGVVNLSYGLAGVALTVALSRGAAPRWLVLQSRTLWLTTLALGAAGFARSAPALVATTAAAMAQFVAFAAVVAWRLDRHGHLRDAG